MESQSSSPHFKLTMLASPFFVLFASTLLFSQFSTQAFAATTHHLASNSAGFVSASFYASSAAYLYLPFILLQVICGLLLDYIGPKISITLSALAITAACAFSLSSYSHFNMLAARLLMCFAASNTLIAMLYLGRMWLSLRSFVLYNAFVAAVAIIAIFLGEDPISELIHPYYWMLIIQLFGLVSFGLAFIYFLIIEDAPTALREILLKRRLTDLWQNLNNSKLWLAAIYTGLVFVPVNAFSTLWAQPFLKKYYPSISNLTADLAASTILIGIALGAPLLAKLSLQKGNSCSSMLKANFCSLVLILVVLYVPNLPFSLMVALLFAFGLSLSSYTLGYVITLKSSRIHFCGLSLGITGFFKLGLGTILMQVIAALLTEHWTGNISSTHQVYSMFNFHFSLAVLPICLASSMVAILLLNMIEADQFSTLTTAEEEITPIKAIEG